MSLFSQKTLKKIGKISFKAVDVPGKIQTKYLPNKSQVESLLLERICLTASLFCWTWEGVRTHTQRHISSTPRR